MCHKQVRANLASKGFLPVDEYIRLKQNPQNHNQNELTLDNIVQDE
jgi:hypothetical protein